MNDVAFLGSQLLQGYADDPWHGPSTVALLAGLTAEEAAARPVAGAHSIWELVLHMTAWQNEVRKRLGGKPATFPSEGDWRLPAEISGAAWDAAQKDLGDSLAALLADLGSQAGADLEETVGSLSSRDPKVVTRVTRAVVLSGLLQHNAYHSGQIALLRKGLRRGIAAAG
ncbi:MAG: DinB family protein [Acidobacteria bacterium]|nr:DinB family protein [Acidobacteriota bacterium]